MREDGGDAESVLGRFKQAGVDVDALAQQLQTDGAQSFVKSWNQLMQAIQQKSTKRATARPRCTSSGISRCRTWAARSRSW